MSAASGLPILGVVACAAVVVSTAAMRGPLWRRGVRFGDTDRTVADNTGAARDVVASRLTRLEHAIDAIAIEVERIGEHQRFLTKVLTGQPRE